MVLPFFTLILTLLLSGLACVIAGVISFLKGYKTKNKSKISRGWFISVLGTIVTIFATYGLVRASHQLFHEGEGFLHGSAWVVFVFLPLLLVFVALYLAFFIVIGATSLQAGYAHKKEGKLEIESIILGYTILCLGTIAIISGIVFTIAAFNEIRESLKGNKNKGGQPVREEAIYCLRYYLFSIIYK